MYLEAYPTKANGHSTRDLFTLVSPGENLRVPRVREGDFPPKILPYQRRASLEILEAILALYAAGVSIRSISCFLEGIYGAFYHLTASPTSPRLWRKRCALGEIVPWTQCSWTERFFSSAEEKASKSQCTWP